MKKDWTYKKLGEICEVIMGQSPESSSYNKEGEGLPFFQGCSDFGVINPSVSTYCNAPLKKAEPLDVLMSVRAPVGTLNIANVKCCIGRGLAAFRQIKGLSDFKYIYYLLKASQPIFQQNSTGATFKAIGKDFIVNYKADIPSLEEQQHVVSELDLLSGVIEKQKAQLEELDKLAQSIFNNMFGDPVTNEKGWEVKKLKEICSKITDGTHNSPTNDVYGAYMYITAKNIKESGLSLDNITYVSEEVHRSIYERCNPVYGDVLYIKDGATTGIAVVNNLKEEFSLLSSVALLKPGPQLVNQYLKAVLNNPSEYKCIRSNMGGAAITRLTIKKIEGIEIPLPPLSLQQEFAAKVEAIEAMKAKVRQSLKEAETLFNSRMDYYFN